MQWLWVMSFLPDPGKQLLNRGLRTESLGIETRHYLGTYIRILYTIAIAMREMPLHHSSVKWCYIYIAKLLSHVSFDSQLNSEL